MSMIVVKKRKNGPVYYLVQNLRHEDGKRYQHWIPCASAVDAKLLKPEVDEAEARNEKYVIPIEFQLLRTGVKAQPAVPQPSTPMTVEQLVRAYIEHHSALGFWEAATRRIADSISINYIFPYIGTMLIKSVRARDLQAYYDDLPNHPAVQMKKSAKPKPISKRTVREINKLLRPAFAYAVTLGYIENNPTLNVQMPRVEKRSVSSGPLRKSKQPFSAAKIRHSGL